VSDLVTIIRAIVQDELKSLCLGDIGVVTSTFPHEEGDDHNYECSVRLREGELELRRVPMATPHVGMVSAPEAGDLVLISYLGGDPNRPIVVGRLHSDKRHPPVHAAGEWRVESPLGGDTSIAIDRDAAVVITAGDTTVSVHPSGNIELASPTDVSVKVDGNVSLTCTDCKIRASGNIELGSGGAGVITTQSHKCYYTGAPLVGSLTVKAKG